MPAFVRKHSIVFSHLRKRQRLRLGLQADVTVSMKVIDIFRMILNNSHQTVVLELTRNNFRVAAVAQNTMKVPLRHLRNRWSSSTTTLCRASTGSGRWIHQEGGMLVKDISRRSNQREVITIIELQGKAHSIHD